MLRIPNRIMSAIKAHAVTADQLAADPALIDTLDLTRTDAARLRALIFPQPQPTPRPAPPAEQGTSPAQSLLPWDTPALLTTTEAADILRVTRKTVTNWIAAKRIHAGRLGDDWRIPRAELERLLSEFQS